MSPFLIPAALCMALVLVLIAMRRPGQGARARWGVTAIAAAGPLVALIVALSALPTTLAGEAIRAGFALPGGARFALRLDALALVFLAPMLLSALAASLTAGGFFERNSTVAVFQAWLLAALAALTVLILADPVWLAASAWMLAAILSYLLLWQSGDRRGGPGPGLPGLFVALVAGAFLFTGLTHLGTLAGGQEITLISHRGREIAETGQHLMPSMLIFAGAVMATGIIPFRFTRTRALFAAAPAVAVVLPAGLGLAALCLFARLAPAAGGAIAGEAPFWSTTLMILCVLTLAFAGVSAASRRGLAGIAEGVLSSLLALAFWLAGMGAGSAVAFIVIATVPAVTALFLCAGLILRETGSLRLAVPGGLVNRMPLTTLITALAILSLAGVAPMAGWHALTAALQAMGVGQILPGATPEMGWLASLAMVIIYALIFAALLQVARLVRRDAVLPAAEPNMSIRDPRGVLLAPAAGLVALLVLIGIAPGTVAALAARAGAQGGTLITLWPESSGIIPWLWLASVGIGFLIHGLRPAEADVGAED